MDHVNLPVMLRGPRRYSGGRWPDYASTVSDAAEIPADAALLDQVSADLGAVDEALRRLDEGTYGTCQVCGVSIPKLADPS